MADSKKFNKAKIISAKRIKFLSAFLALKIISVKSIKNRSVFSGIFMIK